VSDPHLAGPRESDPVARPEGVQNPPDAETDTRRHRRLQREHAVIAYVILAVAALIVLRALVDELDDDGSGAGAPLPSVDGAFVTDLQNR
jgi:hypothetical protein